MDAAVADDRTAVDDLLGSWVVQLYSATDRDPSPSGPTTSSQEVWRRYEEYRRQYQGGELGEALLFESDPYNFTYDGYLVVILGRPYSTPEAANAVCDRLGYGPDDCLAKRLERSDRYEGSVEPR